MSICDPTAGRTSETLDEIQRAAQSQFSKQSHRYFQGHILENVEDVQTAIETIDLVPDSRVPDVATDAGHTGLHLTSLGHNVTLADISALMLERAAEAAARRNWNVQTRPHTAEEFPYADTSFDLVMCRVAAHHFSSRRILFAKPPACSNRRDISY